MNGTVVTVGAHGITVAVDQAFGNCPRHIQPRVLTSAGTPVHDAVGFTALRSEHVRLLERSDTFILGTMHPDRGADTSHRGGERDSFGFIEASSRAPMRR